MSHDIMSNSRFYAHRTPAWHGLGYVSQTDLDAIAAADCSGISALKTFEAPLWLRGHAGLVHAGDFKALCGCLPGEHKGGEITTNGETKTVFTYGCVGKDYEMITHEKALQVWHRATNGAPAETIGLLGCGETLFVTARLPEITVLGDSVKNFLMLTNPIDGLTSVRAKTLNCRVVCANTLAIGLAEGTDQQFRSVHSQGVLDRLENWLAAVWSGQTYVLQACQRAFESLAVVLCTPATVKDEVCSAVYPYPEKPEQPKLIEAWVDFCARMEAHRSAVTHLFTDSPTRSEATRGTVWGAYNAVCEYEDFARPRTTARSRFLGAGKDRKEAAFSACMTLV